MSLFYTILKGLAERNIKLTVELKNDVQITGVLNSIDTYLNMFLTEISLEEPEKYPQLISVVNIFIRGSAIRYIHLDKQGIDLEAAQELCRKEIKKEKVEI